MSMLVTILVVILVLVIVFLIRHYRIRKQQPPGPLGLPFVGQLPFHIFKIAFARFLPKMPVKKYLGKMKEKYGDIWSLDMGNQQVIVLASVDSIKEAFLDNSKLFSGRPMIESLKLISEDRGIIFADGEIIESNRHLALKSLRDLGMGKQLLEGKICEEVDELIENIEKNLSTPISSPDVFVKAVANVISQLTFNIRNKYNDPDFLYFIKNLKVIGHSNTANDILGLTSKVLQSKYTRKIFRAVDQFMKSCTESLEFIADKCRSRMKIEGEYSKPNCVFDYFWRYRYQDQPEVDPDEKFLNISHSGFDIYIGGSDTTTNLLSFCCLMLGQYPDIQEELKREIQSLVDDHTLISMDTKKDCPKLLSFIDEVQRYCVLIYVIQRRVLQTCMFRGYKIEPKDIIYADLANSFRDPSLFENPNDFNPYRFMDESRTKYIPNKSLIPFGMGKRACLGEGIAVMEIFLFLSKIIQRFNISLSEETKTNFSEILEGSFSIVHAPLDHGIIFRLSQ